MTTSASDENHTDRGAHQLGLGGLLEPGLDHPLRPRAERLPPDRSGPHDLHEGAQHAAVVDRADEGRCEQVGRHRRQERDQERRHVLHRPLAAGIDRRLGDEGRVDLAGERQDRVELLLGIRIEGRVQRAGGGELGEAVARRQLIGRRPVNSWYSPSGSASRYRMRTGTCWP